MRSAHDSAAATQGYSDHAIYEWTAAQIAGMPREIDVLDIGCGTGEMGRCLRRHGVTGRLAGVDIVAYHGGPGGYDQFWQADLDGPYEQECTGMFDAILGVEVIHCLENPRAFVRSAVKLLKPGGMLVVTTANPLSLASLTVLLRKGVYRNFQDGAPRYPSQIMPLLPVDAGRILRENDLQDVQVLFNDRTRLPGMKGPVQARVPCLKGSLFSDVYLFRGVKPA